MQPAGCLCHWHKQVDLPYNDGCSRPKPVPHISSPAPSPKKEANSFLRYCQWTAGIQRYHQYSSRSITKLPMIGYDIFMWNSAFVPHYTQLSQNCHTTFSHLCSNKAHGCIQLRTSHGSCCAVSSCLFQHNSCIRSGISVAAA